MLVVKAKKRLEETISYAHAIGRYSDLEQKLLFLHLFCCSWINPCITKTILYDDFSPYSFLFSTHNKIATEEDDSDGTIEYCETPVMVGGLIFHNGTGINDGSFSVEIDAKEEPHWSIHT